MPASHPSSILRRVALVDLALTAPFSLPVLAGGMLAGVTRLDSLLGLHTRAPALDGLTLLFVNLTGVLAVCWKLARARRTDTDLARIDVPARLAVAALIAAYVLGGGVSPLLLVFVVTELGGAVLQARALGRLRGAGAALVLLAAVAGVATPARAGGGTPPTADAFCAVVSDSCTAPPYVAVMSAFPAELEPLLARAQVTATIVVSGRTYHVGTLAGVRVVLVLSGIGLVNAATTTRAMLDRFEISAIVFSGVAGSHLAIGDVAVPARWSDGATSFPVDPALLSVAQMLAAPPVPLERCTPVPPEPPGPLVCLAHAPRIVVGGSGESSDPFRGGAFPCTPGGGPVFGCEPRAAAEHLALAAPAPDAVDQETAAVARIAGEAGVPYIALRAVSDGAGDPLGLPGFPAQFFAYYQLASVNAAATTTAFLGAWAEHGPAPSRGARRRAVTTPGSDIGAACDWERAAGPSCAGERAPGIVTRRVARACALLSGEQPPRAIWRRAARLLGAGARPGLARSCRRALVQALRARAEEPAP